MLFKAKKAKERIPDGFTEADIKIESSICHGEKTIGFYSAKEKRLCHAELVKSDEDIMSFYRKYGLKHKS